MMTELIYSQKNLDCTIEDLPDEVLEYILSLLPPYSDLDHCMKVSPRWKKIVENVVIHSQHHLLKSLANFDIQWENITPSGKVQSITKRYSHSACCHDNFMYVFGGCTCTMTTFNDLWKLDLSTRQWSRLLTMGNYPSPKACATLVHHKGSLLLFGGWSHPATFSFNHVWRTFNELHIYDIYENRWQNITTPTSPPPTMAGHSATIHKDHMIIFGGLHGQNRTSNDVWCFNVVSHLWRKLTIQGLKPQSRYCQSQVVLDDEHLLILGGCGGGPNEVLSDVWMLDMSESDWHWKQVTVRNSQWAPSHLWCHPACRVGNYVVAFSRNPVATAPMLQYSKLSPNGQFRASQAQRANSIPPGPGQRFPDSAVCPAVDRDVNVNGRRGSLRSQPMESQDCTSETNRSQASTSLQSAPLAKTSSVLQPLPISNSKANQGKEAVSITVAPQCSVNPSSSNQDSGASGRPSSSDRDSSRSNIRNSPPVFSPENRTTSLSYSRMSDHYSVNNSNNTGMAAFRDNSQTAMCKNRKNNREKQLDAIRRIEERLKNRNAADAPSPIVQKQEITIREQSPTRQPSVPKMAMFVLDISSVLTDDCFVSWLPIKAVAEGCPEDMILYSLVAGNGELIMFGGMQQDMSTTHPQNSVSVNIISETVSNSLHFITAPRSVI